MGEAGQGTGILDTAIQSRKKQTLHCIFRLLTRRLKNMPESVVEFFESGIVGTVMKSSKGAGFILL